MEFSTVGLAYSIFQLLQLIASKNDFDGISPASSKMANDRQRRNTHKAQSPAACGPIFLKLCSVTGNDRRHSLLQFGAGRRSIGTLFP